MKTEHLSGEDLLRALYGAIPEGSHLEQCGDCRERWLALQDRRRLYLQTVEVEQVSQESLDAQRRAIYRRLDEKRRWSWRWVPALAAMLIVLCGLILFERGRHAPEFTDQSDQKLYEDVVKVAQNPEPLAAKPIQGLFEE